MSPYKSKVLGRYGRPKTQRKSFRVNLRILRKVFLFSLPLGIFGGILYFVFLSSYFEIKNVNISGLKSVSEDNVRQEVSKIFARRNWVIGKLSNYFLFSKDLAKAEIQSAFPKIGEIKIEKVYPEILNVEIRERNATGVWCRVADCFYFDAQGVIFEPAPKSFGSLMITAEDQRDLDNVKIGDAVLSAERVSFLEEAKELIGRNFEFSIKNFIITSRGEIEILTSENWRILLAQKETLEYQFSNLKYLLDEEIKNRRRELEYVDLRLGNKLYYKFNEGPNSSQ